MSTVDSTSIRWRHWRSGELLVAIAVKRYDEATMILPLPGRGLRHPLDWMPEASFLREYEMVSG